MGSAVPLPGVTGTRRTLPPAPPQGGAGDRTGSEDPLREATRGAGPVTGSVGSGARVRWTGRHRFRSSRGLLVLTTGSPSPIPHHGAGPCVRRATTRRRLLRDRPVNCLTGRVQLRRGPGRRARRGRRRGRRPGARDLARGRAAPAAEVVPAAATVLFDGVHDVEGLTALLGAWSPADLPPAGDARSRSRSGTTVPTWPSSPTPGAPTSTAWSSGTARPTSSRSSAGSRPASPTWPASRTTSPYRGWRRRVRGCPPDPSPSPGPGGSTRPRRRAAGGCSGRPAARPLGPGPRPARAARARHPGQVRAGMTLHVLATGPLVTVQDRGRTGYAHLACRGPVPWTRRPPRSETGWSATGTTTPCSEVLLGGSPCAPVAGAGWR